MKISSRYRIQCITWLFMLMGGAIISSCLVSCGKEANASATGLNTQINIINLSPDVLPVDFYINLVKQNRTSAYRYSVPSGYIFLPYLNTQLQIRLPKTGETIKDTTATLRANTRYTWFITGMVADKTLGTIFVTDTDRAPGIGRGKVRFINALARSATLDVSANNTMAFQAQGNRHVSDYVEFPAGMYDFKIMASGSTAILTELPNITVQDGRLYTLYTQGIVGRADSAAVTASMLTNR